MNYGSFIREQVIKNLLSSQTKIAEAGNAKGLVILSKFIFSNYNSYEFITIYIIEDSSIIQTTLKMVQLH